MRLVVFDCINFPSSIMPMAALYIIVERKFFFFISVYFGPVV